MTTPLSPAAQAVLNRTAEQVLADRRINMEHIAAAALRAAADQVVPEENVDDADYHCLYAKWAAEGKQEVRDEMLAIAAELEGQ
jgi:hypothetical protein